jgi:single stranded DNA-binding protein (ssb)
MNQVSLVGRLAREPEVFYSQAGKAVAKYCLAVQKRIKGETSADFIDCVSFGKTAETIGNHATKGQQLCVTGRIDTGKYTTREGNTRYYTQVIVPNFTFGARPKASSRNTPLDSEEIPF